MTDVEKRAAEARMAPEKVRMLSPLALAFVGDAVQEVHVRARLAATQHASPYAMHRMASAQVCCRAQAAMAHALMDFLDDEEIAVFKRGRNAKSGSVPRNADVTAYRAATGLEAVLGYRYLMGDTARLQAILARMDALAAQMPAAGDKEEIEHA